MKRIGFTVWFTGLSGSGKTTIALALEKKLLERGVPYVQRLDGDIVRESLNRDLGFSKEDRDENIRRVAFVARLLAANGTAVLASFVSPYREARENARRECETAAPFVEVYVDCPMEDLVRRDTKGLYKKAFAGEIDNFTGVSAPYEPPENPDVYLDTSGTTLEEDVKTLLVFLERTGLLPVSPGARAVKNIGETSVQSAEVWGELTCSFPLSEEEE